MSSEFDDATKKEITAFLENQQAQAAVQSMIQNFTSMCWDKCITGTPSSRFSRGEVSCLTNCVDRFLDTSLFMVKKIKEQRENAGLTSY